MVDTTVETMVETEPATLPPDAGQRRHTRRTGYAGGQLTPAQNPIAQDAVQDLSHGGPRHCLLSQERYRSRPLVAGNPVDAPVEDLPFGREHAVTQHACTDSPHFASGLPITATSLTLRCAPSRFSTSEG